MRTRIVALVFLTVFAAATRAQNNAQNRPPIIDVHVHAYEKDERWAIKVPNPRTGQPMTATSEQEHMRATLAEMKKHNIVKAFVSNQYAAVLRWQAAAPKKVTHDRVARFAIILGQPRPLDLFSGLASVFYHVPGRTFRHHASCPFS